MCKAKSGVQREDFKERKNERERERERKRERINPNPYDDGLGEKKRERELISMGENYHANIIAILRDKQHPQP